MLQGSQVANPSTMSELLAAAKALVSTVDDFSANQCWISLTVDSDQFPAPGGPFAIVCAGEFIRRDSVQVGAGRAGALFDGEFDVTVIDFSFRDQPIQDAIRLTQAGTEDVGLYDVAHAVQCMLDGEFLVDQKGNTISTEPIWVRRQARPVNFVNRAGWAGIAITFSASYVEARP